ncbi:MAG: FAD-binding protein [Lachnospiraceae bacterium]|nr:FAD-binding protein [Lachnospiraceae bacterium]
MEHVKYDVVIAGVGVSGLYTALNLPRDKQILMICKEDMKSCDSMLAQGGICVLRDEKDYDSFYEDTMRAGHYENRKESVDIMIRSSRDIINDLQELGVRFDKNEDGSLKYTKEGAHSKPRICFHEDITGKEITETLQCHVKTLPNITIMEYTTMTDILVENGKCCGIVAKKTPFIPVQTVQQNESQQTDVYETVKKAADESFAEENNDNLLYIFAKDTVLATGGVGGLYEHSTNFRSLTGDGLVVAKKHGVELEHLDYVQIHPTSLYRETSGRSFLISESARGEGAVLLNTKGERFVDELLPRDVVSEAIQKEMKREGSHHVWLSFRNVPTETIREHFPHIYKTCLEAGYDITQEPIPVVPAQHYFMGGIHVDRDSETTMEHLYAVGETSCNGVHGKNRLASNSLLESLVFAKRAAVKIAQTGKE